MSGRNGRRYMFYITLSLLVLGRLGLTTHDPTYLDASSTAALDGPMRIWSVRKKASEAAARLASRYLVVKSLKSLIYSSKPDEVETKQRSGDVRFLRF